MGILLVRILKYAVGSECHEHREVCRRPSGFQQFIVVERDFVLADGVRSGVVKSVVEWVARARAECVSQEISVEWRGRIKRRPAILGICWRYCAVSGPLRAGNGQRDAAIGVTRLDQAQRLMGQSISWLTGPELRRLEETQQADRRLRGGEK